MLYEAGTMIADLKNIFGLSYTQIGMMIGVKKEPGRTVKRWAEIGAFRGEDGKWVSEHYLVELNIVYRKMMRVLALFDFDVKRCRREIKKKVQKLGGERPRTLLIRGDSAAVIEYYGGLKQKKE